MYNKNEILYKIQDLERRIDKSVVKRCDALPINNVGRILIYDGGVSWITYNNTDRANDITYIRYTPTTLADNVNVEAYITQG